ncbi:MAG: hypothetical protein A4E67_00958 [Syntrophaceae bacterium PtaB.Bin038]|nr:MAG: hypothetical protein A4E67_00958 [Syntrophaceae bacterium PtaB.Bin038]
MQSRAIPPLWATIEMCPFFTSRSSRGTKGRTSPFSRFTMLMQLGPTTRIPHCRAMFRTSCSRSRPWSANSLNPPDSMMARRMPLRQQAARASGTCRAGRRKTARSGTPGTSSTDEWIGTPPMSPPSLPTAWMSPLYPKRWRFRTMFRPRLVGAAETPNTTTLAGKKIFSIYLLL